MSTRDTGGPAFPCEWDYINTNRGAAVGMTLRDYFAAKALSAMDIQICVAPPAAEHMARSAYIIADALLRERSK